MFPRNLPLDLIQQKTQVYRVKILEMIHSAASGHPGGSLSLVETLCLLFNNHLRHDPKNALDTKRDRFVLSKGHGVPALYAALADTGHIPVHELMSLRKLGSRLQGHPDRARLPIVEASTGSLGQGLSIAQGLALSQKIDGLNAHVYCVIGDGESQEGQIWETAMSAPKFKLDNLIVLLDYNGGQIDGLTKDVMDLEPIGDKWRAFNWEVSGVDGHNLKALDETFKKVTSAQARNGRPKMLIANTVKGKGVSFMENIPKWHGVAPTQDELKKAVEEIKSRGFDEKVFGP